jgi:hypothetical protein
MQAQKERQVVWPPVAPLEKTFNFPTAREAEIHLQIHDTGGTPLYLLECHPGEPSNQQKYLETDPADISGDFHCFLLAIPIDQFGDLLHDDKFDEKPWWSRGRLLSEEVSGDCARYPEFGSGRHFRLRGMVVTLQFSRLSFDPAKPAKGTSNNSDESEAVVPPLHAFRLSIVVQPDPQAISAISEPPPYREPLYRPASAPDALERRCTKIVRTRIPGTVTREFVMSHKLDPPYPTITPIKKSIRLTSEQSTGFHFNGKETATLSVTSATGERVYDFRCAPFGYPESWWYVEFVIECGLYVPGTGLNLLGETVDPYSRLARSIILPTQLYGTCAEYPDWGSARKFRLRGLQLTIQISELDFDPKLKPEDFFLEPALRSARMLVTLATDDSATSPVAQVSGYSYPSTWPTPATCKEVLLNRVGIN